MNSSTSGSTATSLVRGRLVGIGADQRLHADARQPQAEGAAGDRQQHAFGHELPEQPAAAGAERRAHGKLTMTGLGARQQQVREIRAGDEQHESDGGLQDPDRAAGAADDRVLHRLHLKRAYGRPSRPRRRSAADAAKTWSLVPTPTRSPQFCISAFSSVCAACGLTPSFNRPIR